MPGFGSSAKLSICRQNSMGATAPGSWYQIPFARFGLPFSYGDLTDDSIRSTPDLPDQVRGIAGFAGDVEHNVFPLAAGFFLRGLFGVASAEAVGSGFLHTFNPAAAAWSPECTLPPYAFQLDPGEPSINSAYLYQDAFVNGGEISLDAAGYLRSRWSVLGKSMTLLTKAPGAALNPDGAAPLVWSAASISVSGAAVQRFSNFRFAFDNKIVPQDRIAGALEHTYFFRDGFRDFGRLSGTIDLAQADWLTFKAGSEGRLVLNVTGAMTISSGVNEYFRIDIPRFKYTAYPIRVDGAGIVTVGLEGRAQYSQASGTACTITLCNTFPSYAA